MNSNTIDKQVSLDGVDTRMTNTSGPMHSFISNRAGVECTPPKLNRPYLKSHS